jgi:hypothetical protein
MLVDALNQKSGEELQSVQQDLTLALMRQQNEELTARIEAQEEMVRKRFEGLADKIDKVAHSAAIGTGPALKVKVCNLFVCLFGFFFFFFFLPKHIC